MKKRLLIITLIYISISLLSSCSKKYEIIFESNGGTPIDTQLINKNGKVVKPNNPTKEGYNFLYWSLNDKEYDFNEAVNESFTLVAKWQQIIDYTEGLQFIYTSSGYVVKSIGVADYESTIIIPSTYNNIAVVGIKEYAFLNCNNIIKLIIPDRAGIPNLHPLKNNGVF